MKKRNKNAIVLLSGGVDSSTCLDVASKQFDFKKIYTLSFDYGQKNRYELKAAKKISNRYKNTEHIVMKFDLRIAGNSALTDNIPVPDTNLDKKNTNQDDKNINPDKRDIFKKDEIPVTYVPGRNTVFLAHGCSFAEAKGCRHIFIGVNAVDYSGYPDCRPEYIETFQKLINIGTKAGVTGNKITIQTPFIQLSKAEIIKLGTDLGVDYSLTLSCYNPDAQGLACGRCDSCYLRKKGFQDAGVVDPTRYK
jgi:7-cyano-7-deazaguanine synthase